MARGRPDYGTVTDAEIDGWLRAANLLPIWTLDGKTGAARSWALRAPGRCSPSPRPWSPRSSPRAPSCSWTRAPSTFGLVRDSDLNTRNSYWLMVETFEQLAFTGVESLEASMTVCADGTTGAAIARTLSCPV